MAPLEDWFKVSFDEGKIALDVRPPGRQRWSAEINWSDIERICYETTDPMYPDDIYIFVKGREESYSIPTEAYGGMSLWFEIIDRKLFDAELAIAVATTAIASLHCWPPIER